MNIGTCLKYLDYVVVECDRILEDGKVSGDELIHLITELQLFKDRVQKSELQEQLKNSISNINLDYTIQGVERTEKHRTIGYILLRGFSRLMERRMMEERNRAVHDIRSNCERLSFFIRSNY